MHRLTVVADVITPHNYDNGKQKYEMQQTIQPGDQMWVNFGELIHNRVPDRKGNLLPADLASATYDLRDLSPGPGSLLQGTLALDKALGFGVHPLLYDCCGWSDETWDPTQFDVVVNGLDLGGIQGVDGCDGNYYNISYDFDDWWSGNQGVALVTAGQVKGVSPGSHHWLCHRPRCRGLSN